MLTASTAPRPTPTRTPAFVDGGAARHGGDRGDGGERGPRIFTGGMRTKIEAAKIATTGGALRCITNGRGEAPLSRMAAGAPCTWFLTPSTP